MHKLKQQHSGSATPQPQNKPSPRSQSKRDRSVSGAIEMIDLCPVAQVAPDSSASGEGVHEAKRVPVAHDENDSKVNQLIVTEPGVPAVESK